jgi:hypothetical protein
MFISEYTLTDKIQEPTEHNSWLNVSLARALAHHSFISPYQSLHCQPSKLIDKVLAYLLFPVTLVRSLSSNHSSAANDKKTALYHSSLSQAPQLVKKFPVCNGD